jgi:hypothetical protein
MIEVFTYDGNCAVLKKPFQFVSEDLSGVLLAIAGAGTIGARWGSQLTWAARTVDTYRVIVSDLQMNYAPVVIGEFNAAGGGTFEVIIHKLPSGGSLYGGGSGGGGSSGGGPDENSTLDSIYRLIREQSGWSDEEKEAVKALILAYMAVAEHSAVEQFVDGWVVKLEAIGVPVAALNAVAAGKNASSPTMA